jgi:hypothetical protein
MAISLRTLPVAEKRLAMPAAPARDLTGLLRGKHAVDQGAAAYGEAGFGPAASVTSPEIMTPPQRSRR